MTAATGSVRRSWIRRRWWAVYGALLAASWAAQWVAPRQAGEAPLGDRKQAVEMPGMTDAGPLPPSGRSAGMRVAYLRWSGAGDVPARGETARAPVILLHGSPGVAANLRALGEEVAAAGYETIAPDLPGFGDSSRDVPSYSIMAHARAVLELMNRLGVERAHVVGWSMGGGVALNMADLAPERLASLTMLGSIGDQSVEGSGSYWFEHAKYAAGYLALVVVPCAVPHFGLLGNDLEPSARRSFIRNFWDSDQRPLTGAMERLRLPTLIVHGRRDFLVPDYAAERHHDLIRASRLVMLPHSHFMPLPEPFGQPRVVVEHLVPFLTRHDAPGIEEARAVRDLAPRPPWFLGESVGGAGARLLRTSPWWLLVLLIGLAATRWPRITALLAMLLVTELLVDLGVAVTGLSAGAILRAWWRRGDGGLGSLPAARTHAPLAATAAIAGGLLRMGVAIAAGLVIAPTIIAPLGEAWRAPGLLVGMAPALVALVFATDLVSRRGRWELKTGLLRLRHHEWWPAWAFYLPIVPYVLWLAAKHRHPLAFLAANPGIENGGGWINESKFTICEALRRGIESRRGTGAGSTGRMLAAYLIPEGPAPLARAARVLELMSRTREIGRFPVVLKPDKAQRGYGLKLASGPADLDAYFRTMTRDAVVQEYHPGPEECGVFWIRRLEAGTPGARGAREETGTGFIFSITRKSFPAVVGNGRQTVGELIASDRRLRCQAGVFMARLGSAAERVPAPGERVRLAEAGNHCQGTMFSDGMDLATPELAAAIDRIAAAYPDRDGRPGGLDFGRFDLRYESDEALRRGEGFGLIELNGTSSEATALYDPRRSPRWAYALLRRQWSLLFELGAWRMGQGHRPAHLGLVLGQMWEHYRGRTGSAISD